MISCVTVIVELYLAVDEDDVVGAAAVVTTILFNRPLDDCRFCTSICEINKMCSSHLKIESHRRVAQKKITDAFNSNIYSNQLIKKLTLEHISLYFQCLVYDTKYKGFEWIYFARQY